MKKQIVIIAPFWYKPQNVGSLRIERFIKWSNDEFNLILITAGKQSKKIEHSWGTEIMVKDPLGLYDENEKMTPDKSNGKKSGISYKWKFAQWLLNPDPTIVWAYRAAGRRTINEIGSNVHAVISSGPPESVHILNYKLSKHYNARMIIDMRDGWLDDPLKEYLNKKSFRTLREKFLERKVYRAAQKILVTSPKWKELLVKRFPEHKNKVEQLTNGYIESLETMAINSSVESDQLVFIHAGKFTRSRSSQDASLILRPIVEYTNTVDTKCEIKLIGQLSDMDFENVDMMRKRSENKFVDITTETHVDRKQLFEKFKAASGFLLLSASIAAVPSKLYEYLPFRKPILAVTPINSGLWELTKDIPQVFLMECENEKKQSEVIERFFHACTLKEKYSLPDKFTNDYLAGLFHKIIHAN